MSEHKTPFRVSVDLEHYGRKQGYNLFYATDIEATAARERLLKARAEHQKNRPNDPEKRFIRVGHAYGSLDFDPHDIVGVSVWDRGTSEEDDFEAANDRREQIAKQTADILAVAIREALRKDKP